jgi:hypothetical protein
LGTQPERRMWNPRQGEHNDTFWYTTEELRSVATQYTVNNKTIRLRHAPSNREAIPSSYKETPSDVAIKDAKEGVKGDKKRRKQHP